MSRRDLGFWAATPAVVLLAVGLVVWQRTHATPPCRWHRSADGKLLGLTAEQVEERYGNPDGVGGATTLGEREIWLYDSIYQEPGAARPTPLLIHFDVRGRVRRTCMFDGTPVEEVRWP